MVGSWFTINLFVSADYPKDGLVAINLETELMAVVWGHMDSINWRPVVTL